MQSRLFTHFIRIQGKNVWVGDPSFEAIDIIDIAWGEIYSIR